MTKNEVKARLQRVFVDYLSEHGGAPAFQVETGTGTEEDQELARHVEMMLPTLSELFLHPDTLSPGRGDREVEFRPWIDSLLERMAENLCGTPTNP